MLMQIKNICPKAQLYIMIHVFPDLPYYNIYRNIKFAPTEVKDWYYSLPRSSAKQLNQDTYHVYNELMRLHTSEIRWSGKRTVALSEVLILMSKSTNRNYESLLIPDNDIYSLGPNGPMVDGIHPSNEFIAALWRLLRNCDVFGERNPHELFTTVTTNLDETPRGKMIPHEQISGDYRKDKHDLRSKLSQSSPSPLLGVTENFPSTSSGSTSNTPNDQFSVHSQYLSKKRPASSSYILSSKRLQMSIPLPRPIQRMTLEQIGLIQGQFNIFAAYMMGITHVNTPTLSVEVNPNPQFDASLTSEYSDMSADKASSENLLNDIVNESTNSISTQASNFHQCAKLAYSIHELRIHMCWGFPSHDEIANNFDEPIEQSISEICEEKDISKVVIDANEVVSDLCLELEGLHK
ncbi:putative sodium-dependent multivitamin transporter [Armadillidium vulgare]|nr:putative sodium-dependent multivitamin transporter [Armadillidium vulgare]